jgi:HEAT repeat protein
MLTDPEKESILDVMWETRTSDYSSRLMEIAEGHDSLRIRSWAITILAYLDAKERFEELVPMLDEPDYELRRQLLLLFGMRRVQAAAPRIEKLLNSDIVSEPPCQTEELRRMATQALDKITGKDASPYWK